ncbi:MAG: GNAT family N-acetyltransferase [Candidatus Paceibacterota bacterium]|jgi:ribosomal protein S18 acetylase RimI-like enzyme
MKEGTPAEEHVPRIRIERATGADAMGLREVQRETWLNTYVNERSGITPNDIGWYFDSFKKAFSAESLKRTAAELQEQKSGEAAFVAKEHGEIIGYAWAMTSPIQNELGALYVLPSYQGRHVGTDLWNQARSIFNPALSTVLTVNRDNAPAIAFYERLGFKPTDEEVASGLTFPSGAIFREMRMVRPPEVEEVKE